MNLNPKHKRLVAVLGLSMTALAADRFLFAPQEASAQDPTTSQADVAPQLAATSAAIEAEFDVDAVSPRAAIADRLQLAILEHDIDPAQIVDAFKPDESWLPVVETVTPVVEATPTADAAGDFIESHKLSALMTLPSGGYAIINGRGYHIGDAVGGFTLVEVGTRHALLRSPAGEARLVLNEPGH